MQPLAPARELHRFLIASFLAVAFFISACDDQSDLVTPDVALGGAQRWLGNLTVRDLRSIHSEFTGFEELLRGRIAVRTEDLTANQQPFSHPLLWAPFVYYGA